MIARYSQRLRLRGWPRDEALGSLIPHGVPPDAGKEPRELFERKRRGSRIAGEAFKTATAWKCVASDVGSLGGLGPLTGRHVGGAKRLQGLQTITNAFGVFAARLPSLEFRSGSLNEPFAMRDRVRFFAHMAVASFEG